MNKNLIEKIILEYQSNISKQAASSIQREVLARVGKSYNSKNATILSGLRRVGKSTLFSQLTYDYVEKGLSINRFDVNFEDERFLNFAPDDFNKLFELFFRYYEHDKKNVFFLDEVQNIVGWERFVRRLIDEGYKFFITGSNASLLSKELGTKLTGRHISYEIFPFSFREFIVFNESHLLNDEKRLLYYDEKWFFRTKNTASLRNYFDEYLISGGLPEFLNENKNIEYLSNLYKDIIFRDIIGRYGIENIRDFRDLSLYLMSNISQLFTYRSLAKILNIGSPNTVKSYIQFLEDSYLIFTLNRFDYSVKKQIYYPKKVYSIDNAFPAHLGFKFTENKGYLLENLVFIELKRRNKEVYYYVTKAGKEVDFLVRENIKLAELIQVSFEMIDEKTRKREVTSILEAMEELNLNRGLILTNDYEEELKINNKTVTIKPVYIWLVEQKSHYEYLAQARQISSSYMNKDLIKR